MAKEITEVIVWIARNNETVNYPRSISKGYYSKPSFNKKNGAFSPTKRKTKAGDVITNLVEPGKIRKAKLTIEFLD